eukprot:3832194-Prymnesium_polylepis.1
MLSKGSDALMRITDLMQHAIDEGNRLFKDSSAGSCSTTRAPAIPMSHSALPRTSSRPVSLA